MVTPNAVIARDRGAKFRSTSKPLDEQALETRLTFFGTTL
jgi:hypothetical protein